MTGVQTCALPISSFQYSLSVSDDVLFFPFIQLYISSSPLPQLIISSHFPSFTLSFVDTCIFSALHSNDDNFTIVVVWGKSPDLFAEIAHSSLFEGWNHYSHCPFGMLLRGCGWWRSVACHGHSYATVSDFRFFNGALITQRSLLEGMQGVLDWGDRKSVV